ncbi:MAG TPA: 2,3-bisphosphoglycerate-independent phosphoglycerate mutase [Chloroflexota bacterium]|nr:2,3-bisphosphoglycerate-independent phosphoglycerate mutase [Chloroflexota bacterium]
MIPTSALKSLHLANDGKLILIVLDGLGGLPHPDTALTELESARTPNLDLLAREGIVGLSEPVGPGITPGSGPGHLALFGYDPIAGNIGRGALSALGIGLDLAPEDIGVRLNFCTIDGDGNVADRRAGRISTDLNRGLVADLSAIEIDGVEIELVTESQHRAVLVLRGAGLHPAVRETDPQLTGVPPLAPDALAPEAAATEAILRRFLDGVREVIGDRSPANFVLMRGYAGLPALESLEEIYGVRSACVAAYPMYKGLATIAGMEVLDTGDTLPGEVAALQRHWDDYDFFFFHFKATDSLGEDGNFDGKVAAIEEVDAAIPEIVRLGPAALAVTGDHSTPSRLRQHSWHPVPFLLHAEHVVPDAATVFGERACGSGSLGIFPARNTMSLLAGYAGRLKKFGA